MAIKKSPISPRQKMINLMYIVLMAMLALNVSPEVLEGFSIVEESLHRTTQNSSDENEALYNALKEQLKKNPQKVQPWYDRATTVKLMTDSLFNFAQELKVAIVHEADGADGDVLNIDHKDDLQAASQVMLAPGSGKGRKLFNSINSFRERILKMVSDPRQRIIIESNLTTTLPKNAKTMGKNWQEYMFEEMPVAAAVTLLTKLQSDIRYAEGEVLHSLAANIDVKDIRVNQLNAFVIPNAQTIVCGDKFSARIVMAAVDTTQTPQIFIGGRQVNLRNNTYDITTNRTGDFNLTGYITMQNGNGDVVRRDFSQKYTVVDPSATVSADLMNVLYAGYNNPISISIPGVPLTKVSATMSGGTLQLISPGRYIARPASVGKDVTINVSSLQGGTAKPVGKFSFHVRKLPDPTAYLVVGDNRFRGGGLSKASLMSTNGIKAAIDDGLLDIEFHVLSFETVFYDNMGNALPMVSAGDAFSQRQRDTFRSLARNRRFYINRVKAVGPDGTTRMLNGSIEVIVK